jgi:hypothetical protein
VRAALSIEIPTVRRYELDPLTDLHPLPPFGLGGIPRPALDAGAPRPPEPPKSRPPLCGVCPAIERTGGRPAVKGRFARASFEPVRPYIGHLRMENRPKRRSLMRSQFGL